MIQDSSNNFVRQKQKVTRNELALNREREQLRKADVRRKIQLGGLIVKIGLEDESSSVLLGLLHEAKTKLSSEKERWRKLGDKEFSNIAENI